MRGSSQEIKSKKKILKVKSPLGSSVSKEIQELNRSPFRVELARLLDCAPTDEALRTFATKSPDRWAQAIAILSRLSGFSEKHITEHNVNVVIATLSDAELNDRLAMLEHKQQAARNVIDVKSTLVDDDTVKARVIE